MVAHIRQEFQDPKDNTFRIKGIDIDVENVRPSNSPEIHAVVQLTVRPFHEHNNEQQPWFIPSSVDVLESLSILLDSSRTINPIYCNRTRLIQQKDAVTFVVDSIEALKLKIGDPIVILNNLTPNSKKQFGIVKQFDETSFQIAEPIMNYPTFLKGSIIQNLSNRWHSKNDVVGAKPQLSRPISPTFTAKLNQNNVEVIIAEPLNLGSTKYYDIYLRDRTFQQLEIHWVPDVSDISARYIDKTIVKTYNGGPSAGGGVISDSPDDIYCVVIAKNNLGFHNTYESICLPMKVNESD